MSGYVICHCGKCQVKCNKHGKKAKCDECGKRRLLGTSIKGNVIKHICDECCEKYTGVPFDELPKKEEPPIAPVPWMDRIPSPTEEFKKV